MKKIWLFVAAVLMAGVLVSCGKNRQTEKVQEPLSESEAETDTSGGKNGGTIENGSEETGGGTSENDSAETGYEQEDTEMKMQVQAGNDTFTATLEENVAVDALAEMMKEGPVTISMSDYAGFEKVGSLGRSLPSSNRQTTTHTGDIVLYNNSQIVIFYGSNSWSYTRLGRIDDLTGWEEALGSGDITVTFSLQ